MKFSVMLLLASGLSFAETATVDGLEVYYERAGKGDPAIVLVHCWTCDSTFWREQTPVLAKHFRVVSVDLPGHGKSAKPDVNYDLKLFARAIDGVMRAEKIDRAVLAGHSMGTSVVRRVLEDYPERVAAIVSVDGSVFRPTSPDFAENFRKWAATMRGPDGMQVRRKFIESMFTDATTPPVRESVLKAMLATPEHVAVSAMEDSVLSDIWSRRKVEVPVLAINKRAKTSGTRAIHDEVFAKLEYHELDGVSHFLQLEKPAEVNDLMIGFVKKVGQ